MEYKRKPGGDKTEKTGISWNEEELIKVYNLYIEINGIGIHEKNPKIQKLAEDLKRSIRATEAQLLMFRAKDKGVYGFYKMSSLIEKIWTQMNNENISSPINQKFPIGFKKWASESSGGIRKPFDNKTGRPTSFYSNGRIPTLINTKLEILISSSRDAGIKAILLIGGPGNGKTDSMELIIEKIDEVYCLDGFLYDRTNSSFEEYMRKHVINFEESEYKLPWKYIEIVQDASERSNETNTSAEALINDINDIIDPAYEGLYICCANRGIIDKARREISNRLKICEDHEIIKKLNNSKEFIDNLIYSISPTSEGCWPMKKIFKGIYVWPMDVESLIEKYELDKSPIKSLLEIALTKEYWDEWPSVEYNPIKDNFLALSTDNFVENFFKGLNYFEINSSFRFTFREILSLLAHVIIGENNGDDPYSFIIGKNTNLLKENISNIEKIKELNSLVKCLYPHALFPYYPQISKKHLELISKIKKEEDWINDQFDVREVFKIIFNSKQNRSNGGSTIKRLLDWEEFLELDPSRSKSSKKIDGTNISMRGIDYEFSKSIRDGLTYTEELLTNSEIDYLQLLDKVETNSLGFNDTRQNMLEIVEKARGILKRYCSIFIKRSIGTRYGFFNKKDVFEKFTEIIRNPENSPSYLKEDFREILLEENKLVISFCSNINQPNGSLENDAKVKIDCPIIKADNRNFNIKNLPRWNFIYFRFEDKYSDEEENRVFMINFQLFYAIYAKKHLGLNISCLSPEVIMNIDNIASMFSSKNIRNSEFFFYRDINLDLNRSIKIKVKENVFQLLNT